MRWVIRTYRKSDAAEVVRLALRAWAPVHESLREVMGDKIFRHLYGGDWRARQRRDVEAVLADENMSVWVAEEEDRVIGFSAAELKHAEGMGEILMVAVDPDRQDRGVGAQLTNRATDWIRESGLQVVMVSTGGDPGHAPARRVYEKLGFTPVPNVIYLKAL